MNESLKMRVNISLGVDCMGRCMEKSVEFEVPVSDMEKALLMNLPQCEEGKTTELKEQIPTALYDKIRFAAIHEVENVIYMEGYNNGYYELDAQKWFAHDVEDGTFCMKMPNGQYMVGDTLYNMEDQELMNIWYEHESQRVQEKGIEYLRCRYEQELTDQTDLAGVSWSLEF